MSGHGIDNAGKITGGKGGARAINHEFSASEEGGRNWRSDSELGLGDDVALFCPGGILAEGEEVGEVLFEAGLEIDVRKGDHLFLMRSEFDGSDGFPSDEFSFVEVFPVDVELIEIGEEESVADSEFVVLIVEGEVDVFVGLMDFGSLGGDDAVGVDDAVAAEVVVVGMVAVVAAVGEEFEFAFRPGEFGEVESEEGLVVEAGSGVDGDAADVAGEGAIGVLGVLSDTDSIGVLGDFSGVIGAGEFLAVVEEADCFAVVGTGESVPLASPVRGEGGGDGSPGAIVDEEFEIAALVEFESPAVVAFGEDGIVSAVGVGGSELDGDG